MPPTRLFTLFMVLTKHKWENQSLLVLTHRQLFPPSPLFSVFHSWAPSLSGQKDGPHKNPKLLTTSEAKTLQSVWISLSKLHDSKPPAYLFPVLHCHSACTTAVMAATIPASPGSTGRKVHQATGHHGNEQGVVFLMP